MMQPPSPRDIARFRAALTEHAGWFFDDAAASRLAHVLAQQTLVHHCDYGTYLERVSSGERAELAALAQLLTITETSFLRNIDQLVAFIQVALPAYLNKGGGEAPIRVLSFGCASGEEPYSLAMMLQEHLPEAMQRVQITAADLNPAMLAKARHARYSAWSLRDTPQAMRDRWFTPEGNLFALDETIVAAVRFEQRNLVENDPHFWQAGRFDIVFCRNVLMYFTPAQARAAVGRIAAAMTPGGYLFLGHAETLRGLSEDFEVFHTNDAFYYRRQTPPAAARPPQHIANPTPESSWVAAIEQASARIHALSCLPAPAAAQPVPAVTAPTSPNLAPVLDFLDRERFEPALTYLQALPPEYERNPDVRLLKAVLYSHSGALAQAEATCFSLLQDDELNAGAHYVLALCRESQGDLTGALEQDQLAAWLDPGFAMPRVHMGLIARRRGDHQGAAQEMKHAIRLLQQEDPARLLLFGGGFKREALMALCKQEPLHSGERR
ncbi:chemotaxis protein methyltransferase CheR [Silvimonas terrae]|uniref:Chemotaxis protein methyltransferase CheR n=1 Tax=Silvimonas terrae TaxID=300266 RepID=A0A840REG6_9NEIS|nr:CheR family methyltransferase [Silvimonas terrae]MBB5190743.1 chemotaxis protein methyltransferase CheR [Silvimonas terrae]